MSTLGSYYTALALAISLSFITPESVRNTTDSVVFTVRFNFRAFLDHLVLTDYNTVESTYLGHHIKGTTA
jgi:hypothetical protein